MNKLKKIIVTLSKLYPNNELFGSEMRKIARDIQSKSDAKEKNYWDEVRNSPGFIETNLAKIEDSIEKRRNKNIDFINKLNT